MTNSGRYASDIAVRMTGPKTAISPEGGRLVRMINKTGANSIKGTVVQCDTGVDEAFQIAPADAIDANGIVYEDGIPDGSLCWVVEGGIAEYLLKDGTLSTRDNWIGMSDVAGRADMTNGSPPSQAIHFQELGHCCESQGAGSDVLAKGIVHFN